MSTSAALVAGTAALEAFLQVVFLVVLLCLEELSGPGDLRDDRPFEDTGPLDFLLDGESLLPLLIGMIEYRGTVLLADVGTLPVQGGGIVHPEEDVQEFVVCDLVRVELDPDGFGMTGSLP
jgi:hypothetical protein